MSWICKLKSSIKFEGCFWSFLLKIFFSVPISFSSPMGFWLYYVRSLDVTYRYLTHSVFLFLFSFFSVFLCLFGGLDNFYCSIFKFTDLSFVISILILSPISYYIFQFNNFQLVLFSVFHFSIENWHHFIISNVCSLTLWGIDIIFADISILRLAFVDFIYLFMYFWSLENWSYFPGCVYVERFWIVY